MAAFVLLVHDDIAVIAAVKRLLTRAGHEFLLATSVADATTTLETGYPELILLAPAMQQGAGAGFVADLRARPDLPPSRVVLLGLPIPGEKFPTVPMPLDGAQFQETVREVLLGEPNLVAGSLAPSDELDALEREVLAEAAKRRALRGNASAPKAGEPFSWVKPKPTEDPFAGPTFSEPAAPPPVSTTSTAPPDAEAEEEDQWAGFDDAEETEIVADPREALTEENPPAQVPPPQATVSTSESDDAEAWPFEEPGYSRGQEPLGADAQTPVEPPLEEPAAASSASDMDATGSYSTEASSETDHDADAMVAVPRSTESGRTTLMDAMVSIPRSKMTSEPESSLSMRAPDSEAMISVPRSPITERANVRDDMDWSDEEAPPLKAPSERELRPPSETALDEEPEVELFGDTEEVSAGATEDAPEEIAVEDEEPPARATPRDVSDRHTDVHFQSGGRSAVPRTGELGLWELLKLSVMLSSSRGHFKLTLTVDRTVRTLWIRDARLVGATSNAPRESIVDQARRDGLIDVRQERELKLMQTLSSSELLRVFRERRYLRELEVLPLVQRHTEQIALQALSEPRSFFELLEGQPPHDLAVSVAARPWLAVVADGVRRHATAELATQELGSADAVATLHRFPVEPGVLGFSEREIQLLRSMDGESSVQTLRAQTGLSEEAAVKSVWIAWLLGLIEVRPVERSQNDVSEESPELELRRLEAKYQEIQDTDYFSMLGLPRNAGHIEVVRAFERLSQEFHPLKYTAHTDPSLQRRAQQIQSLLEEAAHALRTDSLRLQYARSLRD
jgi:hypothetical protein